MLLNKKYKCPVCSDECITLKDKLQIINKGNINCNNCNAKLDFAPKSDSKSCLPLLVFLILTLYFVLTEFNDLIELIGFIIIFAYLIFFHELEEYKVVETKYDLNEFLDGLRNTDTKKSL